MDTIHLTGIRGYGYTGLLPEERILGQWFEVELIIWIDLSPAGNSDDISQTLDYRNAIARTQHLLKSAKFALIEKLATAIAQAILELERVEKVRVKLSKPAAPIPDFGGTVAVEVIRE